MNSFRSRFYFAIALMRCCITTEKYAIGDLMGASGLEGLTAAKVVLTSFSFDIPIDLRYLIKASSAYFAFIFPSG